MNSGIWVSAGHKGVPGVATGQFAATPFLDEIEAECHVSDGDIIANVAWYDVPIGLYNDVRIRARTWRREVTVDIEPVTLAGSTVRILLTLSFPDES